MKKIYVNLKRFDVPKELGGVNSLKGVEKWGSFIASETQTIIEKYHQLADFAIYFPEAHILPAMSVITENSSLKIGCQSVYREDIGKNFGAFTSNRPATAMKAMGVTSTIIGHCEERNDKSELIKLAGSEDINLVNKILNKEIKAAIDSGMEVLYCIGEKAEEQDRWQHVLAEQLKIGLKDVDVSRVTIAYEPVWAIGPGKTPPDKDYIQKVVRFIKEVTDGLAVVYGGGLKEDNANMLQSIPEVDGGLIALTRFSGDIGFYPEEFENIVKQYLL